MRKPRCARRRNPSILRVQDAPRSTTVFPASAGRKRPLPNHQNGVVMGAIQRPGRALCGPENVHVPHPLRPTQHATTAHGAHRWRGLNFHKSAPASIALPLFDFRTQKFRQTWPSGPYRGLDWQSPRYLCVGSSRMNSSMQAWWAAGSVMLTQGSSACACAGGLQRGASAIAAAADTPDIALFMSSSCSAP
jgi:hypothetical protein